MAGPHEFEPYLFNDPEVMSLSERVEIKEEQTFTKLVPLKRPAIVEIIMADGSKLCNRVDLPKGEPENPMSDMELKKKFTNLSSYCRSEKEISKIISIVEKAEENIREIFPYLY